MQASLDKMANTQQTTFPNAFSWKKNSEWWFKFHCSLVLGVLSTISPQWFRLWLGTKLATSQHQCQCWPSSEMHIFTTWVGCFTNISQTLQNNLAKLYNARIHIYGENFTLKLCTCAQSHALGTCTKLQLEILIRNTILREYFGELVKC